MSVYLFDTTLGTAKTGRTQSVWINSSCQRPNLPLSTNWSTHIGVPRISTAHLERAQNPWRFDSAPGEETFRLTDTSMASIQRTQRSTRFLPLDKPTFQATRAPRSSHRTSTTQASRSSRRTCAYLPAITSATVTSFTSIYNELGAERMCAWTKLNFPFRCTKITKLPGVQVLSSASANTGLFGVGLCAVLTFALRRISVERQLVRCNHTSLFETSTWRTQSQNSQPGSRDQRRCVNFPHLASVANGARSHVSRCRRPLSRFSNAPCAKRKNKSNS